LIIEWLPEARRSRFEQLDYIAQDNPMAAISQDEEIERQVAMLVDHPKMGRPGRVSATRELVVSSTPFVLVYRFVGVKRIEILRFLHSSQQWPKGS
jgi:toxin ParE1/3/4